MGRANGEGEWGGHMSCAALSRSVHSPLPAHEYCSDPMFGTLIARPRVVVQVEGGTRGLRASGCMYAVRIESYGSDHAIDSVEGAITSSMALWPSFPASRLSTTTEGAHRGCSDHAQRDAEGMQSGGGRGDTPRTTSTIASAASSMLRPPLSKLAGGPEQHDDPKLLV